MVPTPRADVGAAKAGQDSLAGAPPAHSRSVGHEGFADLVSTLSVDAARPMYPASTQ